jgi:hypothetical protein
MLEIALRHLDFLAGADVRTRGCVLITGFLRFQVRGVNFHAFTGVKPAWRARGEDSLL